MMSGWSRWQRCQKEGDMMPRVMRCPKWQGHKMGTRCPKQIRFKMSWNLVQWCNHPAPSGAKSKDDTPEIWCRTIDSKILNKSMIQQNKDEIRTIRREIEVKWSELRWKDFRNPRISEKCELHKHSSALVSKILKCIFEALRCVRCRFWSRKWIQNGPSSQE